MSWSLEPFRVKAVCAYSLDIDENSIDNVVSSDRATQAPRTKYLVLTNNSNTRQQGKKDSRASPRSAQCELYTTKAGEAKQGDGIDNHIAPELFVFC